jgi:hypothetical protein
MALPHHFGAGGDGLDSSDEPHPNHSYIKTAAGASDDRSLRWSVAVREVCATAAGCDFGSVGTEGWQAAGPLGRPEPPGANQALVATRFDF